MFLIDQQRAGTILNTGDIGFARADLTMIMEIDSSLNLNIGIEA